MIKNAKRCYKVLNSVGINVPTRNSRGPRPAPIPFTRELTRDQHDNEPVFSLGPDFDPSYLHMKHTSMLFTVTTGILLLRMYYKVQQLALFT